MSHWPILSAVIFAPWVGALLVLTLHRHLPAQLSRALVLLFSLSTLGLGLVLRHDFNPALAGFQFEENNPWISALNVHYHLGLDGLSLVLVLLTGIISPLALFGTS